MTTIEKASAEVRKYFERELELVREFDQALVEITKLHERFGSAIAENQSADLQPIVDLRSRISLIESAAGACRLKRTAAIVAKFAAEADDLKSQAAAKRRELVELEEQLAKPLKRISELQGVAYGLWLFGRDVPGMPMIGAGARPRSELLRWELSELDGKIEAASAREVERSGTVDVTEAMSPADLFEHLAVVQSETPPVASVLEWLELCGKRIFSRNGGRPWTGPRRIRLVWNAGTIDPAQSYVFVPELAGSGESFNVRGAEFRTLDAAGQLAQA